MKLQCLASQGVYEKYERKSRRVLFLEFRGYRWSLW